jgi:GNAT superfamily N-acetyltransferase
MNRSPRLDASLAPAAPHPVSDAALARRLERAEGLSNLAFVQARARVEPERNAAWIRVGGAFGLFDGTASPLTQSFGVGLAGETEAELDALEAFFDERGADTSHEISPMADARLLAWLPARGYRPVELTSVLCMPLLPADAASEEGGPIGVRRVAEDEADGWAEVAARGWSTEAADLAEFVRGMGRVSARGEGTACFLAEAAGKPVAAGALFVGGGVALLAGASTVPEFRARGAQTALLRARLRHAAAEGCDLAMIGAAPGSASQRNAQRQGFRIAYTRIKWCRSAGADDARRRGTAASAPRA